MIQNPSKRFQFRPAQVLLQPFRFVYRRGFRQGHQEDTGECRISELGQQILHVSGQVTLIPQHLPVIGLGGIQQQERVPGGGGVQHYKLILTLCHRLRKGLKDRNLLRTGGAQFLFEQGPAGFIQILAGAGQHLLHVGTGDVGRVDAGDLQIRQGHTHTVGHVGGRIGGGKMNRKSAQGQPSGDSRGQSGFTHPAFSHGQHHSRTSGGNTVHQFRKCVCVGKRGRLDVGGGQRVAIEEGAQGCSTHQSARPEGKGGGGQGGEGVRQVIQTFPGPLTPGEHQRIVAAVRFQQSIDSQHKTVYLFLFQFACRPGGLFEGAHFGTADQHHPGFGGVAQGVQCLLVDEPLLFQSGQRAQAGGAGFVFSNEIVPGCRQGKETEGVPGGGGVQHHVIVGLQHLGIANQFGEFVKGGNLHGAGPGKLLLNIPQAFLGQHPP